MKRKGNNISAINLEAIKRNIKAKAKEKNKTIEQICKALGYYRDHINKMQNPSAGKLIDIAHAIGCEPTELLKGT